MRRQCRRQTQTGACPEVQVDDAHAIVEGLGTHLDGLGRQLACLFPDVSDNRFLLAIGPSPVRGRDLSPTFPPALSRPRHDHGAYL